MSEISLEKIDLVRERTGVSYRRAMEALEATEGDVVRAIVLLEGEGEGRTGWQDRLQQGGNEFADRVRELIHEGSQTRIIVRHNDRTVLDLPATVGVVGAVLAPILTAAGAMAAVATHSSIQIERRSAGSR